MNRDEHEKRSPEVERGMEGLEAALAAIKPGFDEETAVAIATSRAQQDVVARARRLRWSLPALAGGGLALWAVVASGPTTRPPLETIVRVGSRQAPSTAARTDAATTGAPEFATLAFSITAPDSGRVAVFQTSNPKIRVVWFYDESSGD
jgi:hypothetical protein